MDRDNLAGTIAGAIVGIGSAMTFAGDLTTLLVAGIEEMLHHPLAPGTLKALTGVVSVCVTVVVQTVVTHWTPRKEWTPQERQQGGPK